MITLESLPLANPNVVSRVIEDEAVLVLPQKGKVKVLNEVGARIWSLVDGKRRVRDIAEAICGEYEVTLEVAQADTLDFLTELLQREVLTLKQAD